MALEDWSVEVTKLERVPNPAKNPYTGLPIDPDGLTMSRFEMTLTHTSGKVLHRSDLLSTPSKEAFAAYARGVIGVAELNMAAQADVALVGLLVVVPPAPADTRTQAQKDEQAFQQASSAHAALVAKVEALKAIDPDSAAKLDSLVAESAAAKDAAAAPVIAALTKGK